MSFLMILLLAMCSSYAHAISPLEQDRILIYQNSDGSTLLNSLKVYDNVQLNGEPIFIIDKDNLNIGEKKISLKSPVSCKHLNSTTKNCDEIILPVDFLNVRSRKLYLLVENKIADIAKIRNKNKNYYLELKKTSFIKSDWPDGSEWHSIIGSEAKLQLQSLMKENLDLKEFIKALQLCIKAKDKKCISRYSTNSGYFDQVFKYRTIADDPSLCKNLLDIWGESFNEDMDYVLKKNTVADSEVTWKDLDKVFFNLENSDVQAYLNTSKFSGVNSISLILKAGNNLKCENDTELEIQIEEMLNAVTNKKEWKISYFNTYNRKNRDK